MGKGWEKGVSKGGKSQEKPGQGRGPKRGGDPGSASGQFLGRLPGRTELGASFLGPSGGVPFGGLPPRPALSSDPPPQPARGALTPEEARAQPTQPWPPSARAVSIPGSPWAAPYRVSNRPSEERVAEKASSLGPSRSPMSAPAL